MIEHGYFRGWRMTSSGYGTNEPRLSWAFVEDGDEHSEVFGAVRRPSRSEFAASYLARLADRGGAGVRLGTKAELRGLCNVSVGTFNEAVKLAQDRGFIVSRTGPGGGIFAAERSPMAKLGNSMLALDGGLASVREAIRIRDVLDSLVVEDAVHHAGSADVVEMRVHLAEMSEAAKVADALTFVRANWALHARIAKISPGAILRSMYLGLLELIESHTLAVASEDGRSKEASLGHRLDIHVRLVDAIEHRDLELARHLIDEHNTHAGSGEGTT